MTRRPEPEPPPAPVDTAAVRRRWALDPSAAGAWAGHRIAVDLREAVDEIDDLRRLIVDVLEYPDPNGQHLLDPDSDADHPGCDACVGSWPCPTERMRARAELWPA